MKQTTHLEFFDKHLRSFVPPNSFDAHAHLYRKQDSTENLPSHLLNDSEQVDWQAYSQSLQMWMGDRTPTAGLFFTIPKPELDRLSANRFVAEALVTQPDSCALMMIHPEDDPEEVRGILEENRFMGFKVYHVYAARQDTFNAAPDEFIPDWAWQIANELELVIMLHLVRSRALADPINQQYIRDRCRQYPKAHLILAHAGRGFNSCHTAEGIAALRGIKNLFFDTSAICESQPLETILREFGPGRLLFGTDFPVSEILGRCVSIADGFQWLGEDNVDWESSKFSKPVLVGLESLLALKQACRTLHLIDSDVERIFSQNARELLDLEDSTVGFVTQQTYRKAKQIIPGGTQLLSKRPEMYAPERWPAYFTEARGCEVVDLEGRRFCDMTTSGIGSCLLGYADPDVNAAVIRRVELGSMCTLNSPEELELAELLISIHPWAEQVRYCRTGGEAMAVAVRIARARTQTDHIAFCGYHGWSDWYLAANLSDPSFENSASSDLLREHLLPGLEPAGVPKSLAGTTTPFSYNNIDQLHQIIKNSSEPIAAVVMEPTRSVDPKPQFLQQVRELCDQCGAILIFDEITTGWRMHLGGVHLRYGVEPDIAVFAKAISNGHPMSAIIGRSDVMQAAQDSFISSTYWTEGVGPTAALTTIRKMKKCEVPLHVEQIGSGFRKACLELGDRHQVPIKISGHAAILHIGFDHPQSAALGTLLTTRMLVKGFLVGSGFYPSLAHTEDHINAFSVAAESVFAEMSIAIQQHDIIERLDGPIRHGGFSRLN